MSSHAIDAVSLSIMWDRLVGITDEIVSALIRSSFSTIVRESGDLSVVVLDAQGNSIAQGSYSVPSFTGTAATTLRHMLAKFPPDSLEPGDVIATNDAWMGTGHLFDINVPLCYTRAMACYAVKCLTVPAMPNNEGAVVPIRVSAPPDSILNAQPPYPTGGRHVTGHMVVPLVFRTLADAVPGQVQADCGMMNIVTFQGTNPGGRPMSTIYFSTGGFGALQGLDGAETTPGPSNMRTVPTEMWESLTGITIVHKRLLPDTGGHGEARGGLGQEIEFRNDTGAPLTAFCVAPRSEFPARGLFGGGDGSRRTILIDGRAVHPKGAHTVAPGQRFTMRDAGGGGFGEPATALSEGGEQHPRSLKQAASTTELRHGQPRRFNSLDS